MTNLFRSSKWLLVSLVLASGLSACSEPVDRFLPEPSQGSVTESVSALDSGQRIKSVAPFSARVVVLSEEHYDNDNPRDPLGEFAPVDIAVGWGIMGEKKIRDEVSISQSRRRYSWWASARDIPMESIQKIGASSANWHLIPADKFVRKQILKIDEDDEVQINGRLVSVSLRNGDIARSSLTRADSGDGACEIIWVE